MNHDELYMQRALELALSGRGAVAPNPLVGCVVVHNQCIIGEGWHRQYGGAHAEVHAIASVQKPELLQESTVYVNLEPCAHYGKTPPCSQLLINKRVKRVVVATFDPFIEVAGRGIAQMEAAGIEICTGVLEEEARFINRSFFTFHEKKRPYLILKWAQSADGYLAPAQAGPYWLSSPESKLLVHRWRAEVSAIMVGARTVLADNPALTTRLVKGRNPVRIVLEKTPLDTHGLQLFDQQAPSLRYTYPNELTAALPDILSQLHAALLQSVMVEGGAATLQAFLQSGTFDEIRVFHCPVILGGGLPAPVIPPGARLVKSSASGIDNLKFYLNSSK
jgi:diaminohydroxyphosphoribosylaminopyrimidine deaminase/5-amino-6-(5-phosphoribosylamino)uracil reductase